MTLKFDVYIFYIFIVLYDTHVYIFYIFIVFLYIYIYIYLLYHLLYTRRFTMDLVTIFILHNYIFC